MQGSPATSKIAIVSGLKRMGKTTGLQRWVEKKQSEGVELAGIVCPDGEDGLRKMTLLSESSAVKFQVDASEASPDDVLICDFRFRNAAFEAAKNEVKSGLDADYVVIDEIGPLELRRGAGLRDVLDEVMTKWRTIKAQLVIVIRESMIDPFCELYGLSRDSDIFLLDVGAVHFHSIASTLANGLAHLLGSHYEPRSGLHNEGCYLNSLAGLSYLSLWRSSPDGAASPLYQRTILLCDSLLKLNFDPVSRLMRNRTHHRNFDETTAADSCHPAHFQPDAQTKAISHFSVIWLLSEFIRSCKMKAVEPPAFVRESLVNLAGTIREQFYDEDAGIRRYARSSEQPEDYFRAVDTALAVLVLPSLESSMPLLEFADVKEFCSASLVERFGYGTAEWHQYLGRSLVEPRKWVWHDCWALVALSIVNKEKCKAAFEHVKAAYVVESGLVSNNQVSLGKPRIYSNNNYMWLWMLRALQRQDVDVDEPVQFWQSVKTEVIDKSGLSLETGRSAVKEHHKNQELPNLVELLFALSEGP